MLTQVCKIKMITIYKLNPVFIRVLQPIACMLHRKGITANQVALFAMLTSTAYGAWMALAAESHWPFLILPGFMLFRMTLNAIDGMLARDYRKQTKVGAILNEVADVVSDAALYAPFALFPGVWPPLVMVIIFFGILTEFIGVMGQEVGGSRRYDGPFGKSDRAFAFGCLGPLIGMGIPILSYLNLVLIIMSGLLLWTIVNCGRQAIRTA